MDPRTCARHRGCNVRAAMAPSFAARAALAVLVTSCGGTTPPHRDLQVMAFSPQGSLDAPRPVEIKFDQPVVAEAMVGKPADPAAVAIVPATPWKGFWQDRQTLVIEPGALTPSTRYQVTLAGELAARTRGFQLAFVYQPLAVEGLVGADADALAPGAAIPLGFNQPVRPADAAAHCKLIGDGDVAIALAAHGDPAKVIALTPATPIATDAGYTLTCADLAGAGGPATLDAPYALALHGRPGLRVTALEPSGDGVPADEVTLSVSFSTPVTLDAARKAITSTPAIPALDQGYLSGDGTTYQVTVDLDDHTHYRLAVDQLVDTFGQPLAEPAHAELTTGEARARLSMQRGIFALEASARGFPLWSRNVGKVALACGAVPKARLVQLLTTDMNYDPWGGNDDDQPIAWAKLGVAPRTTHHAPKKSKKWVENDLDLARLCNGPGPRGVFLAEVTSDEIVSDPQRGWLTPRRNRVLANITDLGVVLEVGSSSGLVWVTSIASGAPVGGASVTVYTPAGKAVFAGVTSDDGLVSIPGSALLKRQPATDPEAEGDWDSYRSQRLIAVIEHADDLAIVDGNWSNGIQTWNFGARGEHTGATLVRGFLQSDRGLYRPGETVHFKGLAREVGNGRMPRVPRTGEVAVEITDSRGQVVSTQTAKLSSFGGFAWDLALGPDAAVGDYYVAATLAGQVFRERFSVEEFRPTAFELAVKGLGAPRPGEPLGFALDAHYLYGAPVAHAKVEWGLRKRGHVIAMAGYEDYTFTADPQRAWWRSGYRDHDYGEMVADGTGETDAQGHLAIDTRDEATAFTGPVDYILTTSVADASDQTMTRSAIVTAHQTAFYLGLHANEFVQAVGMPFGVNLVALTPDGARVATAAHLSFIRNDNTCRWSTGPGRSSYRCDTKSKLALERDVQIAAGGSHTERIFPTEPGEYVVRIEARDARGQAVAAESPIWVIGKGEAFWSGDEGDRMTVIASKPKYAIGDTAKLVAQANLVAPTALITIERDGILEARVQRMASATAGIALPIVDRWAPNVFARVAMVSGRHGAGDANRPLFKMGLVELAVEGAPKQLDVAIALDRDHVRPGEPVTGKITVRQAGKPVAAEVSLSAADEGVLQLIAYETPNPMKTFYAPYGLGVDAGTNWNRIARIADPAAGDPDQGGDAASSNDAQRVRSKFVASAYWAPALVTDARGEIAFSFVAPDNLTAFRLMAVAADAADRFGAGERRLTVAKPVMATPALPRFLRTGDAATVGVVIRNLTDHAGSATVTATATGATLDRASDTVAVPAGGEARVRFAARTGDGAAATFGFTVALGAERDAVQVTLPVIRPRVIDRRLVVDQAIAGTWRGRLGTGADVLRDESELAITVDRTGVGELAPGLRALVEYPYGCLEQTLSRFLPLVAARDLARTLDDPSLQGTRAKEFIAAGIAKVIRHQQGDGLFSLWPQSQTYPHLAAYALWGLTVAEQAGEAVPRDVFDRGVPALKAWASGVTLTPGGDAATVAMAAYVMALRGQADPALAAQLYSLRLALPRWGQAFLLRAMKLGKAPAAQVTELEALIASEVTVKDGRALVREPAAGDELYMASDVRATAMTLAALLEVDPRSPLIDPLAAGLKAARTREGAWVSTQDNLWSLVALAAYGRRAPSGDASVAITAGGVPIAARRLTGGEIWSARIPLRGLADDLAITATGGAHVTARVTEARLDGGAAASNGFTLTRAYYDAAGRPVSSVKVGEVVTVKLAITAAATHRWVALVDPLPAGLEVMNARLATGATGAPPADPWANGTWRTALTWSHQDARDDRVEWFSDGVGAGSYELTYEARATIAGSFSALPATIEAMYQPDLRARTPRAQLTVKP
jgi:uncharacterized protein YfaS (alpha-2-macroglobulin family)